MIHQSYYRWLITSQSSNSSPYYQLAEVVKTDDVFPKKIKIDKKRILDHMEYYGYDGGLMYLFDRSWNEYRRQNG